MGISSHQWQRPLAAVTADAHDGREAGPIQTAENGRVQIYLLYACWKSTFPVACIQSKDEVAHGSSQHGEAEVSHGKQHFSVVAEPAGPAKCGPLILSDDFHIVFLLSSTDNGRVCRKSSRTTWSRFAPFRQNLTGRDHVCKFSESCFSGRSRAHPVCKSEEALITGDGPETQNLQRWNVPCLRLAVTFCDKVLLALKAKGCCWLMFDVLSHCHPAMKKRSCCVGRICRMLRSWSHRDF